MNEAETKSRPAEDEALFDMEDLKAAEAEEDEIEAVEDTTEPMNEEVGTPTETETKEAEVDYKPLLDTLSKNIKYMDEEIKIESIDDVVKNYQKGLDYDRKIEKLNELENSEEMTYLKEKAKESGMTTKDYIKAIKDYEIEQEKKQDEAKYNEMVESGLAESIAREVVETAKARREFQRKEAELNEKERLLKEKESKEAENELFLQTYPNVDIKSIPKEVFVDAEKTNLLTAYTKYQNQQLLKELELLKQNQKNEKSSPVTGTTEHGGVVVEKQDDFLRGLGVD